MSSILSKKRYFIGIGLMIMACFIMHLFVRSLEKIRLLHYVLEAFGYYTGYLDNPLVRWLWPILFVALFVLIPVSLGLAFSALNYNNHDLKWRYKAIPICLLLISIISCMFFPFVNGLFLRTQSGLNGVILDNRDTAGFVLNNPYDSDSECRIMLSFSKLSSGGEHFYVKFVGLDNNADVIILDYPMTIPADGSSEVRGMGIFQDIWYPSGRSTGAITYDLENIPGYDPELDNWRDLRFKIVIFNENESKTFYRYFYDY